MGALRGDYSEPVMIELYVGADDKNSSINILQVRFSNNQRRVFNLFLCIITKVKNRFLVFAISWINLCLRCHREITI